MRSKSILLYLAVAGAFAIASCSDDTVEPEDRSFSLEVTVVDGRGDPMEGMNVQVHAPIVGVFDTPKRARTVLPFTLPVVCDVTVSVSHLDGRLITILTDAGEIPAGSYQISWNGKDIDGEPILGTVPVKFRLVATSIENASILYDEETIGVLYTSIDVAQQPVLGQTNGNGKLRVTDRSYFPALQDLPSINLVNYMGEVGEPMEFDETIQVVVREPSSGDWVKKPLLLRDGPNELQVRWVDPRPGDSVKVDSKPLPVLQKDIDFPPPSTQFSLGPVFPNPFN